MGYWLVSTTAVAFAIGVVGVWFVRRWTFASSQASIGSRRPQDIHRRPVSRFGGSLLLPAVVAALVFHPSLAFTRDIAALLIGAAVMLAGGLWDDKRELSPVRQGGLQSAAIIIFLALGGIRVGVLNNPLSGSAWMLGPIVGIVVAAVWLAAVVNAVNWIDGLDGLGSAVLLAGFLTLAAVSALPNVNQPPLVIVSLAAAGAMAGSLVFTFPPARVFLGSGGVYSMGLLLGGVAVLAGGKLATAGLVLGLPLLDAGWVIVRRIGARQSVARGDVRHLHHLLLRSGYTPRQVLGLYSAITVLFGVMALALTGPLRLAAAGIVIASFFALVHRGRVDKS